MATRYEDIWHEQVSDSRTDDIQGRTGYSEREIVQGHLEHFLALPGMVEEPRHVKYDLWEGYCHNMVAGSTQSERLDWFREVGIDPRDFDWEGWREEMGY